MSHCLVLKKHPAVHCVLLAHLLQMCVIVSKFTRLAKLMTIKYSVAQLRNITHLMQECVEILCWRQTYLNNMTVMITFYDVYCMGNGKSGPSRMNHIFNHSLVCLVNIQDWIGSNLSLFRPRLDRKTILSYTV